MRLDDLQALVLPDLPTGAWILLALVLINTLWFIVAYVRHSAERHARRAQCRASRMNYLDRLR